MPIALAFAAWSLANLWGPQRQAPFRAAILFSGALALAFAPISGVAAELAFMLCWVAVIGAAVTALFAKPLGKVARVVLSIVVATATGALAATEAQPLSIVKASPILLVVMLGNLGPRPALQLAARIVSGWLIAIALLSAIIPLVITTPGYRNDHME